ncbi:hypothetical protein PFISCL1PPCAC_25970, partial [Pristionchus fissidentatus]
DEPLAHVTKVNVVGCVIMPETWVELSRLFPLLKTVKITEDRIQFPIELTTEVTKSRNRPLEPNLFVNQRQLTELGALKPDRVATLRLI